MYTDVLRSTSFFCSYSRPFGYSPAPPISPIWAGCGGNNRCRAGCRKTPTEAISIAFSAERHKRDTQARIKNRGGGKQQTAH
jgi:hypothetical protein